MIKFIILVTYMLLTIAQQELHSTSKTELVYVIFRHGDRTPVDTFPTDPYKDPKSWPVGFGQLTPRGKQMQYELGKWLRNRYSNILGTSYNPDVLHVRSTDVDRTLMSALSNLAGLYPPEGEQVWNPHLLWQPIPVHTVPIEEDNLLSSHAHCPKMTMLIDKVMASQEVQRINAKYEKLYDFLTEKTGANVSNMNEVNYIFDSLYIESLYNKTLPSWTHSVFPEQMRYLRDLSFTVTTWTPELKRLRSGPILEEMVNTFQLVQKGDLTPEGRKMIMYSGHDTTISSYLNSLGMFDPPVAPPYAATVLVELHSYYINGTEKKQYGVKFLYRNDSTKAPFELVMPHCGEPRGRSLCPLEDFVTLTQPLRPYNWEAECENIVEDPTMHIITIFSFGLCMLLAVMLIMTVLLHCCKTAHAGNIYFSLNQDDNIPK